jgi:hypothetical protein
VPSDVFRAIDAVLVLGVDDNSSPEGAAADAIISQYELANAVGSRSSKSDGGIPRTCAPASCM